MRSEDGQEGVGEEREGGTEDEGQRGAVGRREVASDSSRLPPVDRIRKRREEGGTSITCCCPAKAKTLLLTKTPLTSLPQAATSSPVTFCP